MSQVPDKVLSWLYSVLHEYQDPQRTYSDAARVLSAFLSLSPRTEVYTYENGSSALLLTVSGTLPVDFRGATYRFPIKLWVPQSYPQESPIVYVMPGRDMLVRPGQHVGVEGRVYHPYLSDWSGMWDRANIADFLGYLQQAFAREPPLVSKAQQQQLQRPMAHQQYQAQQTPGASPAPPQLPPKQHPGSHTPIEMPSANTPPPRPPKPGDEGISRGPSRNYATDGPPLPPLPGQNPQNSQYPPRVDGYCSTRPPHPSAYSGVHQNGQTTRQSPLPALPQHVQQEQQRLAHDVSPVSPVSPPHAQVNTPGNRYSQPPPLPAQPHNQVHPSYQQGPAPPQQAQYQQQPQAYHPSQTQPQPNPQYNPQHQQYVPRQTQQPPPQPKKQPPPDLLSDPFEVALPSSSGPSVPAPPIPPNPEKEHLLQAISTSLVQQAQQKVNQNMSAIAPLQAQQNALRAAHARLEAEIAQLEALDATLSTNESILHRSIQDCNHTISEAKSKKQPPIDEVLVAPTLVAQQLWTLTAEEAACREAMYVLQKAVDRGRISGSDFVRQMRGLGRESFLKMVLARKCATGLGLDVDR